MAFGVYAHALADGAATSNLSIANLRDVSGGKIGIYDGICKYSDMFCSIKNGAAADAVEMWRLRWLKSSSFGAQCFLCESL